MFSAKVVIGSPKDFAEFADANVNNISVIYVPNSDIITEPNTSSTHGTLQQD